MNCRSESIKIVHIPVTVNQTAELEYIGSESTQQQYKSMAGISNFPYSPGDELLFIGYADGMESGIPDNPEESRDYIFQFATNIPCPGSPTIFHDGKFYSTIQIFSQCWLKENLNAGVMIQGNWDQTNNGTLDKYCNNNDEFYCNLYGGLYQWDEMLQYTSEPGARGICPKGWSLPMDEEWKTLEGAADSLYGIGDILWDSYGFRGYDAGKNLKTTHSWIGIGNGVDIYGFSGLPGGTRTADNGDFSSPGYFGTWWSSSEYDSDNAWYHTLSTGFTSVYRDYLGDGNNGSKFYGFSVRCLRDEQTISYAEPIAYWSFNDTPDEQLTGAEPSAVIDLSYEDSYKPEAGKAAKFNGATTIIEFPDGDEWMDTNDFTLSFWVKTNSAGHVNENGDPKGHFVIGLGAFYGFQFEISGDYSWCKMAASYELADSSTLGDDLWFAGDGDTNWQGWTYCQDLTDSGGVAALLKDTWAHVVCVYN